MVIITRLFRGLWQQGFWFQSLKGICGYYNRYIAEGKRKLRKGFWFQSLKGICGYYNLIADIALAHRGSGRRGFPVVIAKIMPGDGRREDDGDTN